MSGSRMVIGAGGTGRTHLLRTWADELTADGANVAWLTGSPALAITAAQVAEAAATEVVVADDVQWFEADALRALLDAAGRGITVLASRRPASPDTGLDAAMLDAVDEQLGRDHPPTRLGLLAVEDFASALAALRTRRAASGGGTATHGAMATDEVNALHDLSGGSVGFADDLLASGWDRTGQPPGELVDAVGRRVRRAGTAAAALTEAWTLAATVPTDAMSARDVALAALASTADGTTDGAMADGVNRAVDGDMAERAARAGGLVGTGDRLIPVVERAVLADLTAGARAAWHDRLGSALINVDERAAARHLGSGTGTAPGTVEVLVRAAASIAADNGAEAAELLDRADQFGLDPATGAVARGVAAFHAGDPEALAYLERAVRLVGEGVSAARDGTGPSEAVLADLARLGFGLDMRDLRFDDARRRPLAGPDAEPLSHLATLLDGVSLAPTSDEDGDGHSPSHRHTDGNASPVVRMLRAVSDGLAAVAEGRTAEAMAALTAAADDHERLAPTATFGLTPHQAGTLASINLGDQPAALALATQAVDHAGGGPGESFAHQLLHGYASLIGGDYQPTLAVLRAATATPAVDGTPAETAEVAEESPGGDESQPARGPGSEQRLANQRDRLILSALEAAIARRSGDTGRLRAAWSRAEEALLRGSASWLLADFLIEILACGARLGDTQRIEPILASISAQADELPPNGPAPVVAHWLRLQVAIAADDAEAVAELAAAMSSLEPVDRRSQARVAAASAWAAVMARSAEEEAITAVADELVACGDAWEASRLLGQAALDEPDPQAARRLLERARATGVDAVDDSDGDGLASLGLSDREAEVAVLVVEGRTHKEIGAQLYISPKTVEHHVAKIRQKVGAGSRAELLSIVREALGTAS